MEECEKGNDGSERYDVGADCSAVSMSLRRPHRAPLQTAKERNGFKHVRAFARALSQVMLEAKKGWARGWEERGAEGINGSHAATTCILLVFCPPYARTMCSHAGLFGHPSLQQGPHLRFIPTQFRRVALPKLFIDII